MTTELYLHCFIACLIGNVIHLAAKLYSLSKDYHAQGKPFSLRIWWGVDSYAFIFNFVGSMGLVYIAGEWIDSPYVLGKIKTAFVVVGVTGSWAIMQLTSRAKKSLREDTNKEQK